MSLLLNVNKSTILLNDEGLFKRCYKFFRIRKIKFFTKKLNNIIFLLKRYLIKIDLIRELNSSSDLLYTYLTLANFDRPNLESDETKNRLA